jgi:hypothetical protein
VNTSKKSFALRLDADVYDALEKWATDDFRSINGQIEWLLSDALKKAKRYPKHKDAALSSSKGGQQ